MAVRTCPAMALQRRSDGAQQDLIRFAELRSAVMDIRAERQQNLG